ncbi:uncharacterized protein I206_106702 [Kwoniella pini CBS 10737]|uniref:F-box domain-containing protein n=1 Tax=Kwoniella pini CBS 10737 TaxID=1296096 RepID=A0A1B9HTF9_9TREE|nr:uncharacterized protein I206_07409 [Kwoniella pini CBS 10737]OCF46556.1 hypothetical protein I206_07409 [Kwoniella pini CBS 10737]
MGIELGPEIWAHVFRFCGEKDDEGLFVPQKTLATCLRVNKAWYLLASPHLYYSPMLRDIGAFFRGADKPIPPQLATSLSESISSPHELYLDCIQQGNTKLPLLHQIRQLRLHPYEVLDRIDDEWSNDMNRQYGTAEIAKNILLTFEEKINLTPKLESIILGSYLLPTGLREKTMSDLLFSAIRKLYSTIFTRLRPRYWCEFDPPTGHSPWNSKEVLDLINYSAGGLPEFAEIHTTLEDPPCIQWGTINRVTVRDKADVRKYLWPKITFDKVNEENGESVGAETTRFGKGLDGEWPIEAVQPMDQECWVECLHEMIRDSIPSWFHKSEEDEEKIREKIDAKTVVEVYGIEKFLTILPGYPGGPSYLDEDTLIKSKIPEDQVNYNCYINLKSARFTPEILSQRNDIYKSIFKYMEISIKESLDIDPKSNKWKDSGKSAPEIKLFLAIEYPGCKACGQGKADEWIVDARPRPPPRDDDSDWTDEDEDDDMNDGFDDSDLEDMLEYDDEDVYDAFDDEFDDGDDDDNNDDI